MQEKDGETAMKKKAFAAMFHHPKAAQPAPPKAPLQWTQAEQPASGETEPIQPKAAQPQLQPAPVPQSGGPELPMPMQPQGVQHVQNQQQLDVAVIAQRLAEHHQSESTAQTIYVYLLI